MTTIAVVGAGQAAQSLIETLRVDGFDGRIALFGAEPVAPYQRPPLSKKYLLGEMSRERLAFRPEPFYVEQRIETRWGATVARIDRAAKRLALSDGETVAFDKLAITTGARPRRLPAEIGGALPGVHTIRDLADIDAVAPAMTEGRRLLVVGGGYIGLEAAAVAARLGLSVVLLEAASRILARVAAPETADYFTALHRGEGVEIRTDARLEALTPGPEGRVAAARLADGETIPCDLVLVGIGVQPNAELAAEAGLEVLAGPPGGIRVDAAARTSDPDIVAAGDVAAFPFRGAPTRLESVQNAIDQGAVAARALLDQPQDYAPVPWFWSDQYDVKLQIAGLNTGYDRVILRPGDRPGSQSVWYFEGDALRAVDAMNDPRAYMTAKRGLEAGRNPDPDRVSDPATPLKELM
ncbi:MAG: FAD-dependent oxidoreductase [Pseudomonadota bacterium]